MKLTDPLRHLPLASLASTGLAAAVSGNPMARMAPENPSGDYAPSVVDCPSEKPKLRSADGLSDSESDWLESRRPKTVDPMLDFMKRSTLSDFDYESYFKKNSDDFTVIPNVAIACSGGGYRALLNCAGFIAAADNREPGSTDDKMIGGLLQSSTYLAGLSGGGWFVSSMYGNNFSSVTTMRNGYDDSNLWSFYNSIIDGPDDTGISIYDTAAYWSDVDDAIDAKRDAGFEVSLTDTWGRMLSYQLINDNNGGPAYTFSSIADAEDFSNGDTPFPILVATERNPENETIALSSSVVEFNPYEMGSWDPTIYGFTPTKWVGSNFSNGAISDDGSCVQGLDQVGLVFGTSSSLFNVIFQTELSGSDWVPDMFTEMVNDVLNSVQVDHNDVSVWAPNPFQDYNKDTNVNADSYGMYLADGGLALENIPLQPLLQKSRAVDVIFAVDSSADNQYSWPNATALRATYDRSQLDVANGTQFPKVPSAETFINLGMNAQPAFFGCDTSEFEGGDIPPLVVYIPNTPYTTFSNKSTTQTSYEDTEMFAMIQNGWSAGTMANGTDDANWTGCAACAMLQRSLLRTETDMPASCQDCFDKYCWNGETDDTPTDYAPTVKYPDANPDNAAISLARASGMMWGVAAVAAGVMML